MKQKTSWRTNTNVLELVDELSENPACTAQVCDDMVGNNQIFTTSTLNLYVSVMINLYELIICMGDNKIRRIMGRSQ